MRAQNCSSAKGVCNQCAGEGQKASVLSFAQLQSGDGAATNPRFRTIDASTTVLGPHDSTDNLGVEDPRILYDANNSRYIMYYTCFNSGGASTKKLRRTFKPSRLIHTLPKARPAAASGAGLPEIFMCGATATDPTKEGGWTRHGHVGLPAYSKSGALLLREATSGISSPEHLLFWGAGSIYLSRSRDVMNWPIGDVFITQTAWGNPNVESGPPPMRLSTGDYIFFINSWNGDFPKPPGYQPAWVILSGKDPSRIVQEAWEPLFSPQKQNWMTGEGSAYCNVANVAFIEAAHPTGETDTFRVYFGGADAVIGTAVIKVRYSSSKSGNSTGFKITGNVPAGVGASANATANETANETGAGNASLRNETVVRKASGNETAASNSSERELNASTHAADGTAAQGAPKSEVVRSGFVGFSGMGL